MTYLSLVKSRLFNKKLDFKFLKAYLCYHVQTTIARGKVIIVDLTIVYVP